MLRLDLFVMTYNRDIRWICYAHARLMYMLSRPVSHSSGMDVTTHKGRTDTHIEEQMFRDVRVTHSLKVTPEVTPESHRWKTV